MLGVLLLAAAALFVATGQSTSYAVSADGMTYLPCTWSEEKSQALDAELRQTISKLRVFGGQIPFRAGGSAFVPNPSDEQIADVLFARLVPPNLVSGWAMQDFGTAAFMERAELPISTPLVRAVWIVCWLLARHTGPDVESHVVTPAEASQLVLLGCERSSLPALAWDLTVRDRSIARVIRGR